jgi:hypothetical protein
MVDDSDEFPVTAVGRGVDPVTQLSAGCVPLFSRFGEPDRGIGSEA